MKSVICYLALMLSVSSAFLIPVRTLVRSGPNDLQMRVGKHNNGGTYRGISLLSTNQDRIESDDQPTKVFVANLPFSLSEEELGNFCQQVGSVIDVKIITDRETGRSKGYGFVRFTEPIHATAALEYLDGKELKGRPLRVQPAIRKTFRSAESYSSEPEME